MTLCLDQKSCPRAIVDFGDHLRTTGGTLRFTGCGGWRLGESVRALFSLPVLKNMNGSMNPLRHCIEPSADVRLRDRSCLTMRRYKVTKETEKRPDEEPQSGRARFCSRGKIRVMWRKSTSWQIGIRSAKMRHEPVRKAAQGHRQPSSIKRRVKKKLLPRPDARCFLDVQPTGVRLR